MLTVGTLDGDDVVGAFNGDAVDCVSDSSTAISVCEVGLADVGS